jgi:hypothetical protein
MLSFAYFQGRILLVFKNFLSKILIISCFLAQNKLMQTHTEIGGKIEEKAGMVLSHFHQSIIFVDCTVQQL